MKIQFRTVDLDEVQIHYAEAPGPGPALVILHGITGSHGSFLPLVPVLAEQAHVYALDLRGHNLSGRTPGAYQVPDYGRDIVAFLRTVVGRPAVVAGHSLGGLIAVWLAAQAPDWVRSILLEDPPLYITSGSRMQETVFYGFFVALRALLAEHHGRGGTLDDLIPIVGQFPINAEQTMLDAVGPEAVRERAIELQRMDPAVLDPAIGGAIFDPHEPDDLLRQIRCPVHLLAAQIEFGGAISAQDVQRVVSTLPHCTHTVFERTGHSIHDARPDEYVQELHRFILG
jgi:pimeloyl-ACP methyl ester carboxylesterase